MALMKDATWSYWYLKVAVAQFAGRRELRKRINYACMWITIMTLEKFVVFFASIVIMGSDAFNMM
jgi:hypothetical protein